jgi:hypothetical protein
MMLHDSTAVARVAEVSCSLLYPELGQEMYFAACITAHKWMLVL